MIRDFCHSNVNWPELRERTLDVENWRRYFWHSTKYHFSWCGIAKIGSTTWTQHMIKLKVLHSSHRIAFLDISRLRE